jgi:hypothetical protein
MAALSRIVNGWLRGQLARVFTEVTFANLPTSKAIGDIANVSDSNTATWGANAAGGGSNHVLVRWNGTNWTVVGK